MVMVDKALVNPTSSTGKNHLAPLMAFHNFQWATLRNPHHHRLVIAWSGAHVYVHDGPSNTDNDSIVGSVNG